MPKERYSIVKYGPAQREATLRLKDPNDRKAMILASTYMAQFVEPGSTLVPAVGSKPGRTSMRDLAEMISSMVPGTKVRNLVVRTKPVRSSYEARKTGQDPPSIAEHLLSMKAKGNIPKEGNIYIVDNVFTTGSTMTAMELTMGADPSRVYWLAWSDSTDYVSPTAADAEKVKANPDVEIDIFQSDCSYNEDIQYYTVVASLDGDEIGKATLIENPERVSVELYRLEVDKYWRKTGVGTQIMNEIIGLADEGGWLMSVLPGIGLGATSVGRLRKFYGRFGFKSNKKYRYPRTSTAAMYREPQ